MGIFHRRQLCYVYKDFQRLFNGGIQMNRRGFVKTLVGLTTAAVVAPLDQAAALLNCSPDRMDCLKQCEAGIDSNVLNVTAAAVGGQHLDQWCWAACLEMIFRYYGFVVPQERIVRETWGDIVNLPANPQQILYNLNRPWTDDRGRSFSVMGDVFSANIVTAAHDLADNRPLIIGTMGHAMVLTSLVYYRNEYCQVGVAMAIVRDPWPGRGRRELTPQEWYNVNFLARVMVSGQ
jgi:hypothetical protein